MEQRLLDTGYHLVLHSVMGRGRKRKGRFRRRKRLEEGVTATAHFANSLQPTLPSQWYTYSTSPPALNSLLSLSSTSTEKTNILQNVARLWLNIDHPCYMNMKSRLWTTSSSMPLSPLFLDRGSSCSSANSWNFPANICQRNRTGLEKCIWCKFKSCITN